MRAVEKVRMECVYCRKQFFAYPSHVHRRKYCSKSCRAMAVIESGRNPKFKTYPLREVDDEAFYAWIAGYLDGDGSIYKVNLGWWVISFSGAFPDAVPAMERIQNTIGGPRYNRRGRRSTTWGNNREQVMWQTARQRDISILLRRLLPHLTIKKAKAEQALKELSS